MTSVKLKNHIAKLRADSKHTSKEEEVQARAALLFWGTAADKDFLPYLKGCVGSYTTFLKLDKLTTLTQLRMYCSQKKVTKVISTSIPLLERLLNWDKRKAPKLKDYAGSYFKISGLEEKAPDIEIVFISPLKQLATIPYGKFMAKRLVEKLTKPEKWFKPSKFKWNILTIENEVVQFQQMQQCFLISIDIETFKENATIRCLSYTGFIYQNDGIESMSLVLPLDSDYALSIMQKWNWQLEAPKVFQNGKYDIAYLARYNAPVFNYLYDTASFFHSWYSELPKDLGFLNSFFIREASYWKDLSETTDLHEYYRYNALDTWGTGNAFLAMLLEAPAWAIDNYLLEFPTIFPCHMSEMIGIERDMDVLVVAREKADKTIEKLSARLDIILDTKNFNVKSPPQVRSVLKILGCSDIKSTKESDLQRARFRHPFNARVIKLIIDIREARTLREKYLQIGEKAKEFHRQDGTGNRILYALNPHGTDTSRLASKEHHFWCGLQIQNITRGPDVKCTLRADPGFLFAEVDLEQAESRDTAYLSGDANLIDAVEHSPDFHSQNASAFFGIPFEEIFDAATCKVLDKDLRDLSKRTNHGATYNMGARVMVETMGEEKVAKARKLLGLARFWSYTKVATYLLEQFVKTYPGVKDTMYSGIVNEIGLTNMLVSRATHYSTNTLSSSEPVWSRYCFGNPSANKPALNAYVAHAPQSLNAQTLNKAWLTVFHDIAIHPEHSKNFKLIAQIHDSILFQYRIGHEYLLEMVKERMEIPIVIKGYDDVIRSFTVPAGIKAGVDNKPATYWSEIE